MSSTIKNLVHALKPSQASQSTTQSPSETHSATSSPKMSLAGKTALITGGSKGIGAAITSAFIAAGARVAITYSSDSASADAVVKQHGADKVLAVKSDAGKVSEIEALVKKVVEWSGGHIDILIPNAGVLAMRTLEETTEEDFEVLMGTNVRGPYFLCQVSL